MNFVFDVAHDFKVEFSAESPRVQLAPEGGWSRWIDHGLPPARLRQSLSTHGDGRGGRPPAGARLLSRRPCGCPTPLPDHQTRAGTPDRTASEIIRHRCSVLRALDLSVTAFRVSCAAAPIAPNLYRNGTTADGVVFAL
ncbi:hypothetical protein [Stenotrophomonas rhizophila]